MSVLLQTGKLRLGEIQGLTQGHRASEVALPGLRLTFTAFPFSASPLRGGDCPWAAPVSASRVEGLHSRRAQAAGKCRERPEFCVPSHPPESLL